jgi:hypothetical protein
MLYLSFIQKDEKMLEMMKKVIQANAIVSAADKQVINQSCMY